MSVQLKRRRDTAANVAAYTGAQGELIVDLTNNRVTVHDGVTPGGWAAAKLSEVVISARTSVSDINYTAQSADRTIAYTAITGARIISLPAASAFPTGVSLGVFDESGNASSTRTIALSPSGADLINGASSAVISSGYGYVVLQSNGAASPNGKWTIVDQSASGLASVGVGTAADPNNPLSVYGASALFNGASFNVSLNKSAPANTASILFEDGFSGRAQVGLVGDDNLHFKVSPTGSTWTDALIINTSTGQASFPNGISSGVAIGFRNRLRNASLQINQRNVLGTVTLAAGAYGHDGVKAGASGATYTFAASGIDTTVTITAGSLILPIESALIEGGTYTLSQAGTAQARVWQGTGYSGSGSYASVPLTVTGLPANTQTNVEFATGTVLRPQFEPGSVATVFERRPPGVELALCQRYFAKTYPQATAPGAASQDSVSMWVNVGPIANANSYIGVVWAFPVLMRAIPTITPYNPHTGATGSAWAQNAAQSLTASIISFSDISATVVLANQSTSAGDFIKFHAVAVAEL